jgi:hypothetical protein
MRIPFDDELGRHRAGNEVKQIFPVWVEHRFSGAV